MGNYVWYIGNPPPSLGAGSALAGQVVIFSMVESTNTDGEGTTLVTLDNGITLEIPAHEEITQEKLNNWDT